MIPPEADFVQHGLSVFRFLRRQEATVEYEEAFSTRKDNLPSSIDTDKKPLQGLVQAFKRYTFKIAVAPSNRDHDKPTQEAEQMHDTMSRHASLAINNVATPGLRIIPGLNMDYSQIKYIRHIY